MGPANDLVRGMDADIGLGVHNDKIATGDGLRRFRFGRFLGGRANGRPGRAGGAGRLLRWRRRECGTGSRSRSRRRSPPASGEDENPGEESSRQQGSRHRTRPKQGKCGGRLRGNEMQPVSVSRGPCDDTHSASVNRPYASSCLDSACVYPLSLDSLTRPCRAGQLRYSGPVI